MIQHPIENIVIPTQAWWLILLMSVFATVLPLFMLAAVWGRIGSDQTAISGTLGLVAASVFAVFLLNEAFGVPHFISLACVLLSVFIM